MRIPVARPVAVVILALAALAPLVAWPAVARAASPVADGTRPPGGNLADPVVRQVDIARPAVVRVDTSERATIDIRLCTRAVTLPLSGGAYTVEGTGTGTFVSASGDILTADHVVEFPDQDIVYFAAQDIASLLNNAGAYDPGCHLASPVTANDVAAGAVDFSYATHYSNRSTFVWLSTSYSGVLAATRVRDAPHEDARVLGTSSYTQNDLALIHVNMTDTPSVQLDNSAQVAV